MNIELSSILRQVQSGALSFWCPGCQKAHLVYIDGSGPRWAWNGNADKPTFSPSLLVTWHQWTPPATTPEIRDKITKGEILQTKVDHVCHSFIRDGEIQYLSDCTHALAGKTVPLPNLIESEEA